MRRRHRRRRIWAGAGEVKGGGGGRKTFWESRLERFLLLGAGLPQPAAREEFLGVVVVGFAETGGS